MGLFGKIKEDLSHGGVKVQIQVPESVPRNSMIPVVVSLTSDSPQTITSVKAMLQAQTREQGLGNMGMMPGMGGIGPESERSNFQTIAQVESREPFTISPGENKTVNLQLYLDSSSGNSNGSMGTWGNSEGVMGGLMRGLGGLDHVNYVYRVEASAQVQGVDLSPKAKQSIQLLPPSASSQAVTPNQPPIVSPAAEQVPPYSSPENPMMMNNQSPQEFSPSNPNFPEDPSSQDNNSNPSTNY